VPVRALRVLNEDLGGSPLSKALRAGSVPREWSPVAPCTPPEWREHAARVVSEFRDLNWLGDLRPAFDATGAARTALERVADRGVVVTTGQQPGLFGGALLAFVKAISARSFADALEGATGIPVATVFWAATDDADFDEASSVWVAGDANAARLSIFSRPPAGTPMSAAPLDEAELRGLVPRLRAAAASAAHLSYLDAVERAYSPGATVGSAYVVLMRELLAPLGIAVLDASHPAVHGASRRILENALARARQTEDALLSRNGEIRSRGFSPQVDEVRGLSLVFANRAGIKRRVPVSEVLQPVSHEVLTPTVLLRPVVERAILPSAAYVAGPAELAYFAQSSAVAGALGVSAPLAIPRWSTTIVTPSVDATLLRLGVARHDLQRPPDLLARMARERIPEKISARINELRASIESGATGLRASDHEDLLAPVGLHKSKQCPHHLVAVCYTFEINQRLVQIQNGRIILFPGKKDFSHT
jgi:uncharacterized protein YllA (UPF0747 family)